jgi:predicted N-acetyltransferase YhbS
MIEVSVTRPFVSWYCVNQFIIAKNRQGSVRLSKFINHEQADGRTWLCDVYVERGFRHQGIAHRLIMAAIKVARKHGATALYLYCYKGMFPFYEAFGFQATGAENPNVPEGQKPQYEMMVPLDNYSPKHVKHTNGNKNEDTI